jgi:hypothetical protein
MRLGPGTSGQGLSFIARLNRRLSDIRSQGSSTAGRRAFSASLSSHFRLAFLPPSDEWIFPRKARCSRASTRCADRRQPATVEGIKRGFDGDHQLPNRGGRLDEGTSKTVAATACLTEDHVLIRISPKNREYISEPKFRHVSELWLSLKK